MITHEFGETVLYITLDRPPVNAINREWVAQFDEVLDSLGERAGISGVVVRSAQRVFCAGADLKLMRESLAGETGRAVMLETIRRLQRLYDRIEALPQVTVAAIDGPAVGGGLELALACDLRIATADAQIGLPEARLGLLPGGGGTQRLSRLCGDGIARRLILTGDVVSGTEAHSLGIVQWVVQSDEFDTTVKRITGQIESMAPQALAACKQCLSVAGGSLQHGMAIELRETSRLLSHQDTRARVSDFLETRRT